MNKCKKCLGIAEQLKHKTPVGYCPFGWGPSIENPLHFYVYDEVYKNDVPQDGTPVETSVIKLCEVVNPVQRL